MREASFLVVGSVKRTSASWPGKGCTSSTHAEQSDCGRGVAVREPKHQHWIPSCPIGTSVSYGSARHAGARSLLSNRLRRGGLSGCFGRSLLRRFRRSLFRSFLGSGLLCCALLGAGWLRLCSFGSFERPTALRSLRNGTPASGTDLPLGFCGFRSCR